MSTRCTLPRDSASVPLHAFLRSLIPPVAPSPSSYDSSAPPCHDQNGASELLKRQGYGPAPLSIVHDESLAFELERQMLDYAAEAVLSGSGDGHVDLDAQSRLRDALESVGDRPDSYYTKYEYSSRLFDFFSSVNDVRAAFEQATRTAPQTKVRESRVVSLWRLQLPTPPAETGQPRVRLFSASDLALYDVPAGATELDGVPLAEVGIFGWESSPEQGLFRKLKTALREKRVFAINEIEDAAVGLALAHVVDRAIAETLLLSYPGSQLVRTVRIPPPNPHLPFSPPPSSAQDPSTSASSSLPTPSTPPRPVRVSVSGPLGKGNSAVAFLVWLRASLSSATTSKDDPTPFVLKIASERAGPDGRVRKEGERLLDLERREGFEKCVVPALAMFEERDDEEEGTEADESREERLRLDEPLTRAVVLMRYGGEATDRWSDFTEEERIELFLRLVELHQKHKVLHGSVKPRNAVRFLPVPSAASSVAPSTSPLASNPRWIDLGRSEMGHRCPKACYELKEAFEEMQLREKRKEVKKKKAERGLKW
ncbi:hypothetical protein JCM8097_004107 [Rhodosporidiobolus ruineniae]